MPTRRLLQLAAFAAANVVVVLALSPLNTAIAVLNPFLYAATGGITAVMPLTARVWSQIPGSATLCAAVAGLIAAPFSALGFLLVFALVLPALTFDLVLWRSSHSTLTRLLGAAAAAGIMIWAISLPVIDPEFLSVFAVVILAVIRVISYTVVALIAQALSTRLIRIGVRPSAQVPVGRDKSVEAVRSSSR